MSDEKKDWGKVAQDAWDAPSWREAAEQRTPLEYHAPHKPDGKQADLAQILDDVHAFLGRFVIYPSKEAHDAHLLWIAHTHVMDAWESTPRIAFLSPEPASGKTRALEVSELLVPNPVEAINVSAAYIFRKVGDHENGLPTILHDEIDTLFGPKAKENEDIRGLYNAGHRRGAVAGRCALHGKKVVPEEIPAFSALSLAGLGWLPDTILSRSIVIRMRRRAPHEKITPFRRRDQLAVWAAKVVEEMTAARPVMPEGIEDRNADMWEPLLAIAEAAGEHWPKRASVAAVSLVSDAKEAEPSHGIRLLADCKTISGGANTTFTSALLKALHELPEAPWNDLKGKPLNDRGLALRLRQYGIKSKQVRIGDITLKGYEWADFVDAWKRYLPASPSSDTSETRETSETKPNFQGFDVSLVSDTRPQNVSDVSLVSLVGEGRGVPSDYDAVLEERAAQGLSTNGNGSPPLCDHCGTPGRLNPYDWPSRPSGVILHSSCEGPWFDSEGARQ